MSISTDFAVIPTKDKWRDALRLACQLADEGVVVVVLDNNEICQVNQVINNVIWKHTPGATITQMWNIGWRKINESVVVKEWNVAFFNDDIELLPGSYRALVDEMRDWGDIWLASADWLANFEDGLHPGGSRIVSGTAKDRGIAGWCFMLRGEIGPPYRRFDEQFLWWCGDDDIVKQIELDGGKCAIVHGVPVKHEGTATGKLYPELQQVGWDDMERFNKKWSV